MRDEPAVCIEGPDRHGALYFTVESRRPSIDESDGLENRSALYYCDGSGSKDLI